jgi:hypothetical protein
MTDTSINAASERTRPGAGRAPQPAGHLEIQADMFAHRASHLRSRLGSAPANSPNEVEAERHVKRWGARQGSCQCWSAGRSMLMPKGWAAPWACDGGLVMAACGARVASFPLPRHRVASAFAWNRVAEEAAGMCRRAQTRSRNPLVIHRTLRTSCRMQHEILATRAVLGSARRHAFDGSISSGLPRLEHGRARLEWGSSACCLHAVTNSTLISSPGAAFAPRTLPPIRSTRPRTSDSPMPVPWVLRVSSRSARKNGWKMASRCSC